ncbi:plasma membrane localization protein [Ascosphaera acerosa]|nr:plasma membrane localization protein [Ascosphaera acerosa]
MDGLRQSCRPKHQVLILKCYPKYQKTATNVRPNPSELSYLLYYASTRRSKVQKVGAFLEKRTARDLWRGKTNNVLVTLQILDALIAKCPADLPLYAASVLTILDAVLRSNDLALVVESVTPFIALCRHLDPNLFIAERDVVERYARLVNTYAGFALSSPATVQPAPNTPNDNHNATPPSISSTTALLQWKTAGLRAIQAVLSIDDLGTDVMTQLDVVLPALLENLYDCTGSITSPLPSDASDDSSDPATSARINALEEAKRELDALAYSANRNSMQSGLSADAALAATVTRTATATAEQTATDELRTAELQVRTLALGCLQQIFASSTNTAHIRYATAQTLSFIVARRTTADMHSDSGSDWGNHLLGILATATPVQNRFLILLAAMESLLDTPLVPRSLPAQLVLAALVDGLLASPNNMIGLSVIDVLLGLLQHLLLLHRVSTGRTKRVLHRQATTAFVRYTPPATAMRATAALPDRAGSAPAIPTEKGGKIAAGGNAALSENTPGQAQLVGVLEQCIGHLATHVYYADQVADMVATILSKIRPSSCTAASSSETSRAAADDEDDGNGDGDGGSATGTAIGRKDPKASQITANTVTTGSTASPTAYGSPTDADADDERLFTFTQVQVSALRAVKNVLRIANGATQSLQHRTVPTESRTHVPISAWEETQWMLRHPDNAVQFHYVDALITWLQTETSALDLRIVEYEKRTLQGSSNALQAVSSSGNGRPLTAHTSVPPRNEGSLAVRDTQHHQIDGGGNGNGHGSADRLYHAIASTVSASRHGRTAHAASHFLALLHLAIYEAATALGPGDANDVATTLQLHLVLVTLVARLGVNAVRHGLPMIMRLQRDLAIDRNGGVGDSGDGDGDGDERGAMSRAATRVLAGSLVHGYLLAVVLHFGLQSSPIGAEIAAEVERRKSANVWLTGLALPAIPLNQIEQAHTAAVADEKGAQPLAVDVTVPLKPFLDIVGLVDLIEESYNLAQSAHFLHHHQHQPVSAAHVATANNGPGALGPSDNSQNSWQSTAAAAATTGQLANHTLPDSVKDAMLTSWTRESAVAAASEQSDPSRSSMMPSRSTSNFMANSMSGRDYLASAFGSQRHRAPSPSNGGTPTRNRRLRASTGLSSIGNESSVIGSGSMLGRRSISLREGRAGHTRPATVFDLPQRGSSPSDRQGSVGTAGTTGTTRMKELRRALSMVNGPPHSPHSSKIKTEQQHPSVQMTVGLPQALTQAGSGSGSGSVMRRESSSLSSTYSDHPSLASAHSAMPPAPATATSDRHVTGIESSPRAPRGSSSYLLDEVPPVPPIPPTFNAAAASINASQSQSSLSRPSTARPPSPTAATMLPTRQRDHARDGRMSSGNSVAGTAIAATNTSDGPSTAVGMLPRRRRTRRSSGVPSERTLSLGRRADVERLINGLLEHANSKDAVLRDFSGDDADQWEVVQASSQSRSQSQPQSPSRSRSHAQPPSQGRVVSITTDCVRNAERVTTRDGVPPTPTTPGAMQHLARPSNVTTSNGSGNGNAAAYGTPTPGSEGDALTFFHDSADYRLKEQTSSGGQVPSTSVSESSLPASASASAAASASQLQLQHQKDQRTSLVAGLAEPLTALGTGRRVVRPPY